MSLTKGVGDADDLASAAILAFLEADDGDWYGEDLFPALAQILYHVYLNKLGSRSVDANDFRIRPNRPTSEAVDPRYYNVSTNPNQIEVTFCNEVLHAAKNLSSLEKEAIASVMDGSSEQEAAQKLGIPRGTLHFRLYHARRKLAAAVEHDYRKHNEPERRFRGVHKSANKWKAVITRDGRSRYLGLFDTPEEAAACFDVAALAQHGPKAVLNFPALAQAINVERAA